MDDKECSEKLREIVKAIEDYLGSNVEIRGTSIMEIVTLAFAYLALA